MKKAPVVLVLATIAAISAAVPTGCGLDDFCREGEPGCAIDRCANQLRDEDETDVDCGGACAPCAEGRLCAAPDDCIDGLCVAGACCAAPCVLGAPITLGGAGHDQGTGAAALADGTIVLVGEVEPGADLGPGSEPERGALDVFVTAIRPDGARAWTRRFGGVSYDAAPSVIAHTDDRLWVGGVFAGRKFDSGAGILAGSGGYADLFLVELTTDGVPLRARAWSSHVSTVSLGAMVALPDGGALIAGSLAGGGTTATLDFGEGLVLDSINTARDLYVARLDRDLEPVWATRLGGTDDEFLVGLVREADGRVMLGLDYRGDTDLGEADVPSLPEGGDFALALAELDPDSGTVSWARGYGAPMFGGGLTVAADGDLLVTGDFSDDADIGLGRLQSASDSDAFVARFARDGTPRWMVPFPAVTSDFRAVLGAPDGGAIAAIRLAGELSFDGGITVPTAVDSLVLIGIDAAGKVRWARDEGGILVGTATGLGAAPEGAFVYGGFSGTLTMGAPIATLGKADAFLARFAQ